LTSRLACSFAGDYNLLINERHLTAWAGIQPGYLRQLVRIRVAGEPVSHLAANAWLHPNVPGKRDDFASQPPLKCCASSNRRSVPDGGWTTSAAC